MTRASARLRAAPQSDFVSASAATLRDKFLNDSACVFDDATMPLVISECVKKKTKEMGHLTTHLATHRKNIVDFIEKKRFVFPLNP